MERYFRYRRRPYDPPEDWFSDRQFNPDWRAIGCDYDYLLLTQPYDPQRVGIPTVPVAENASAALLAIQSGACTHRL
jgi:hypothetical protein